MDGQLACCRSSPKNGHGCGAARWPPKEGRPQPGRDRSQAPAALERTRAEIDAIVNHFHGVLPKDKAKAIGAAYARYSTRFQDSIADQVRTLFESAVAEGIFIPRSTYLSISL